MKKLVLSLSLFISFISFAQIEFEEHDLIGEGTTDLHLRTSVSADINGDGFIDVISGFFGKIVYYKSTDGTGVFEEEQHINFSQTIHYVDKLAVSDIDNDGDIDIIASINNGLYLFKNDGLGNFNEEQSIGINTYGVFFLSDIDNDGDIDLLSRTSSTTIRWYRNIDGNGTFEYANNIVSNLTRIADIFMEDIDGDGDFDIIVGDSGIDEIFWYSNDGTGGFGARQLITSFDESICRIFSLDMDFDGDMDIVCSKGESMVWYENSDSIGTFLEHNIYTGTSTSYRDNTDSISVNDVDNDGDMDVVFISYTQVAWYQNNGDDTFTFHVISTNISSGAEVSIVDLNGDGNLDVLSASRYDSNVAWYSNVDGAGNFGTQNIINNKILNGVNSLFNCDIDGDGDLDVLSSSVYDGKIAWYENDGVGSFSNQKIISITEKASKVLACDIDGDGDLDVFSTSNQYYMGGIYWNENIGNGIFGTKQVIDENISQVNIDFIDVDNDGDLDVLSKSTIEYPDYISSVFWYENDGSGNFSTSQIIAENLNNINFKIADIDNDGDSDFVTSSPDNITWYENNGSGVFTSYQINEIATEMIDFTEIIGVKDIDNDGFLDVVMFLSRGDFGYIISWYKNNGDMSFGEEQIIIDSDNYDWIKSVLEDIDNDGDVDILSSGNHLAWFENLDGLGSFSIQQEIPNDRRNLVLSTGDITGNGKADIISCSNTEIYWYENLGMFSNKLKGTLLYDENLDCGNSTKYCSDFLVTSDNGTETISTFSIGSGYYQLFPSLGSYTTTITSELPDYLDVTPISYTHNFTDLGNTETANFCIQPNQTLNDVNISVIPLSNARPGFESSYQIVYKNRGTTQLSGDIVLEYDNTKLNFLTSSEAIASQTANTITFNYSDLNPFETRTINLDFNVLAPPTVNIDDVLDFTASINPITGDEAPDDNVYEYRQTVIGSYDPNDIAVAEGEQILVEDVDKYLHYVIRFQNTGSAHAIKVRVNNILDDKLDWTTLQLESYSHENTVEIKNGSEIDFIFNAIYLPDSISDEPNSHGYIAYKIKPKSTVTVGDVFVNKADIYFDFNTAIETNTVTTEIVNTLAVENNNLLNFTIYPVPTTDVLKINSKSEIQKIEIYNKLGQLVLEEENKNEINTSNLNQGLFFVKITDTYKNTGVKKVFKK